VQWTRHSDTVFSEPFREFPEQSFTAVVDIRSVRVRSAGTLDYKLASSPCMVAAKKIEHFRIKRDIGDRFLALWTEKLRRLNS